jgi:hypothetical protein
MNSKNALIVMTKNPVLGKCKTRLAETLGDEKALAIYIQLLDYTASFSKEVDADVFIYATDELTDKGRWKSPKSHFRIQSEGDLGERMHNAIQDVLQSGYDKAIVIGSDCIEINSNDIHAAFQQLNTPNITLGPALDGGYYLIGIKKISPTLFQGITWSTNTVLKETISRIKTENLTYFLLEEKSDIDVEEDLKRKGYIDF